MKGTIFEEIQDELSKKVNSLVNERDYNLNQDVFDLASDVLIKQIKSLRKDNFEENDTDINKDANEILRTIDQEINRLNETK
ncbi:MAG: hypothetical protein ACQESK_01010 [Bacteroidota bacterium]